MGVYYIDDRAVTLIKFTAERLGQEERATQIAAYEVIPMLLFNPAELGRVKPGGVVDQYIEAIE